MIQFDLGKQYTVEEYLHLETQATQRHEYFHGKLIEMPGSNIQHNIICIELVATLKNQLSKEAYLILMESVKVRINNEDIFLYPDVVVALAADTSKDAYVVKSPILIAEVLSDSTRLNDHVNKCIQYSKIESLQYYLLVEPEKQVVICHAKSEDGEWFAMPYTEDGELIPLPKLNANIRLGDIYGK